MTGVSNYFVVDFGNWVMMEDGGWQFNLNDAVTKGNAGK